MKVDEIESLVADNKLSAAFVFTQMKQHVSKPRSEYKDFVQRYVAGFLASWTSRNYEDYCMRGKHEELENGPVEDALYLADKYWVLLGNNLPEKSVA